MALALFSMLMPRIDLWWHTMLKENAFIHISNSTQSAILFDTFNCKIYKIPYELALKIQSGDYSVNEESLINHYLSDLNYSDYPLSTPKTLDSLRLIITNKCNFTCKYCFAHAGSYDLPIHEMTNSFIEQTIDYFFHKYQKVLQVSFFGGEPLLALNKIEHACSYIQKNYPSKIPSYSLVTNASLLLKPAIKLIDRYDISVIASIDGPEEINDSYRILRNGSGTYSIVDKNIKKFSENHTIAIESTYSSLHLDKGISKSDLSSYLSSRYNTPKVIVADLINNDPSKQFDFDIPLNENLNYFKSFFNLEERQYNDEIVFLIRTLISGKSYRLFCGAGYNKFAVDMFGNVYPCHLFLDEPKNILFNVSNCSKQNDISLFDKSNERCSQCSFRAFCSICTHEIERQPKLCTYQQNKIEFFLHSMLEMFLSNHKKYREIIQGALLYGVKSSK